MQPGVLNSQSNCPQILLLLPTLQTRNPRNPITTPLYSPLHSAMAAAKTFSLSPTKGAAFTNHTSDNGKSFRRITCTNPRFATTRCTLENSVHSSNGRFGVSGHKDHNVTDLFGVRYEKERVQISNKQLHILSGTVDPSQSQKGLLAVEKRQSPIKPLRIFSGKANPSLSQEIAAFMGLDLGKVEILRFADGEIHVDFESVRGSNVFLVQPTCPPVNENLIELLLMIDACKRASARSITAVIPYFGYARADRKTQGREAIAAKLVANMITAAGATRVLACELHSGQSLGYFDIPIDHVVGEPVILDYLVNKGISSNDLVVVSPDVGGVARARSFAKKLSDAPLAIVDKRRHGHNVSEVMNLIGDVKGKVAVMVDDMIDTAGTITNAAALLHQEGAKAVYACCTHAVFSPPAIERLSGGLFQEVITTNTIPVEEKNYFPQLTVLSVANLLAEAILRVDGSVSGISQ